MKKKFIVLLTSLTLLTTAIPAFASTTTNSKDNNQLSISASSQANKAAELNNFLSSDIAKDFHVVKLDKLPNDAKALKFDNWDEASKFLKSAQNELSKNFTKNQKASTNSLSTLALSKSPVDELDTDYYSVGYVSIDSGSDTVSKKVDWDVPGASYQTVYSEHYFDYDNNKVTNSSRGSYISGVGISTWNAYFTGLTHPSSDEWHSIIKGKWGYYISVGGQNVGASDTVGLMAICSAS